MIPAWMTVGDVFIDIHDRLRPYDEIREILETIERTWELKKYYNGSNLGGRWIFQVFSREFVAELAEILNVIVERTTNAGPILEIMSGDGILTQFLAPLLNHRIIPTDAKSERYQIEFPKEIETISALDAVEKYSPSVVLVSWEPFLSMDTISIVEQGIPLIWIGDPQACGHPDLFLEHCNGEVEHPCIRIDSPYAIGRHDSLLNGDYRTGIYVYNCLSDWFT